MKIIKTLSEHLEDELEDAYTYIKLALEYKDTEPEAANLFNKLSQEEMEHMEALHKRVVACIEKYRQDKGDPPAGMLALYEFLHKREIDKAEIITALQARYKK